MPIIQRPFIAVVLLKQITERFVSGWLTFVWICVLTWKYSATVCFSHTQSHVYLHYMLYWVSGRDQKSCWRAFQQDKMLLTLDAAVVRFRSCSKRMVCVSFLFLPTAICLKIYFYTRQSCSVFTHICLFVCSRTGEKNMLKPSSTILMSAFITKRGRCPSRTHARTQTHARKHAHQTKNKDEDKSYIIRMNKHLKLNDE